MTNLKYLMTEKYSWMVIKGNSLIYVYMDEISVEEDRIPVSLTHLIWIAIH